MFLAAGFVTLLQAPRNLALRPPGGFITAPSVLSWAVAAALLQPAMVGAASGEPPASEPEPELEQEYGSSSEDASSDAYGYEYAGSPAPDDSCEYSTDGTCDEPTYCHAGTDCTDCNTCQAGAALPYHRGGGSGLSTCTKYQSGS